jgi:hypothetical protein
MDVAHKVAPHFSIHFETGHTHRVLRHRKKMRANLFTAINVFFVFRDSALLELLLPIEADNYSCCIYVAK